MSIFTEARELDRRLSAAIRRDRWHSVACRDLLRHLRRLRRLKGHRDWIALELRNWLRDYRLWIETNCERVANMNGGAA